MKTNDVAYGALGSQAAAAQVCGKIEGATRPLTTAEIMRQNEEYAKYQAAQQRALKDTSTSFAPGTLVRLKSGGPAMTVSTPLRTDGVVSVEWFNGAALCRDGFDACCLVAAIEGETQQLTPSALNELARKLMVETIELRRKLPPHT